MQITIVSLRKQKKNMEYNLIDSSCTTISYIDLFISLIVNQPNQMPYYLSILDAIDSSQQAINIAR